MDNLLEIDLILDKNRYSKIYYTSLVIIVLFLIFVYIVFTYKYHSYYASKGKIVDNQLEILVNINDIRYIENNSTLLINNQIYGYRLISIGDDLYVDDNYDNYKYVYLKIDNLTNIDNYVYEIKISKENKILAKYLKEYI